MKLFTDRVTFNHKLTQCHYTREAFGCTTGKTVCARGEYGVNRCVSLREKEDAVKESISYNV